MSGFLRAGEGKKQRGQSEAGEEPYDDPLSSHKLHCSPEPDALPRPGSLHYARCPPCPRPEPLKSPRSQLFPSPRAPTSSPPHRTPVLGTGGTAPHRTRRPRGPAHRRASALSAYSMSWLKQPQKGQRVSNTEPSCIISCSIHRREPIFDAILGKGSPLRRHPRRGDRRGEATRNFRLSRSGGGGGLGAVSFPPDGKPCSRSLVPDRSRCSLCRFRPFPLLMAA